MCGGERRREEEGEEMGGEGNLQGAAMIECQIRQECYVHVVPNYATAISEYMQLVPLLVIWEL